MWLPHLGNLPIVLSTLWVFLSSDYSSDYLLFPELCNFLPYQLVRALEVLVAELVLHFFGNVPTSVHGMLGVHEGPVSLSLRGGPWEPLVGLPDANRDRRTRGRLQVCLVPFGGSSWDVNT